MPTSLVPERPLLISPTLAATIGLEEAVMLHVISELTRQLPTTDRENRRWIEANPALLRTAMPFWQLEEIERVQTNLLEKGLIRLQKSAAGEGCYWLAINQAPDHAQLPGARQAAESLPASRTSQRPPASQAAASRPGLESERQAGGVFDGGDRATPMPANWRPDEDLYRQCQQRNIPRQFVDEQLEGFILYWRDRGESRFSWRWLFFRQVIREWELERSRQGSRELETKMPAQWQPSIEAATILENAGVSAAFVEDAVPEFVLYWRERGIADAAWNSKFIAHVRRQWAKVSADLAHGGAPRPISADYQPSAACYEVLSLANIDLDFARGQLKEFILYWMDRGEARASWDTRFLQHVKYKWAHRGKAASHFINKITDRSWAVS